MARYYSYGRRRYGRRYYRRGYRRYGGTSLRRYRSVQMNDDETKVMTFTTVTTVESTISGVSFDNSFPVFRLLSGGDSTLNVITPASGRIFFAGMLFDRLRIRSVQCTLRPRSMPSSVTAGNYIIYTAWDRYGHISDPAVENTYSIQTDPSSKQVVWTPGGSGTPLRTWISSTHRDRYQYFPIVHDASLVSWHFGFQSVDGGPSAPFLPVLLLSITTGASATSVTVSYTILSRITIEFSGSYSNTTLNYTPSAASAASASDAPTVSLEQRIAALESKYNSNPAGNNDALESVLHELSNPQ